MTERRDLYLIFKEAVNNLAKYSQATHAIIRVSADAGNVEMLIKDNGKGFDRNVINAGNGLQNMEQRAKASGMDLTISSNPGSGTTVSLQLLLS